MITRSLHGVADYCQIVNCCPKGCGSTVHLCMTVVGTCHSAVTTLLFLFLCCCCCRWELYNRESVTEMSNCSIRCIRCPYCNCGTGMDTDGVTAHPSSSSFSFSIPSSSFSSTGVFISGPPVTEAPPTITVFKITVCQPDHVLNGKMHVNPTCTCIVLFIADHVTYSQSHAWKVVT